MAYLIKKRLFCLGILLCISNFSLATSSHNIYATTLSILSYAKWNTATPSLCVVDSSNSSVQFASLIKQSNYSFQVDSISQDDLKRKRCDAVFFSTTTPSIEQQLLNSSLNKTILSFSTNNPECEIGSTFCLHTSKSGNTLFKVNLDSLARSKVHVDPRVLLLARNSE